ncbi:MAG: response regulator transcription factor [Acidiferrobacterales bacterium]|nr:response regulator transcription factor [Acidiferrobacterales bacterium]
MPQGEKVLIAEDHELYRDGLTLLIKELLDDVHVSSTADYPSTLQCLSEIRDISLLLLDICMPGSRNLDGLKTIRQRYPTLIIVVISTLDFGASIRQMIDLGANGFIAKSTSKNVMKQAISDILNGEIVVISEKEGSDLIYLSVKQRATLKCLAEGLSNKEIASRLGISPLTAKEYVSSVLERLNAKNRTQAVLFAQRQGLLLDHYM